MRHVIMLRFGASYDTRLYICMENKYVSIEIYYLFWVSLVEGLLALDGGRGKTYMF